MRRIRAGLVVGLFSALLVMGWASWASAQDMGSESWLEGKIRAGEEIVVAAGETVPGDLYAIGRSVRIEGSVEGDLVALAGQVSIPGQVSGDLLAGSGNVDVSGEVAGDIRAGVGQLSLTGELGEDLVAGAGSVAVGGEVGEDLIFGAGRVTVSGQVGGDILGSAGSYSRTGSVGGAEQVNIREEPEPRRPTLGERIVQGLRNYLGVLAVAALLLWLLGRRTRVAATTVSTDAPASAGIGLAGLAGLAVAFVAVVLAMILSGILLGAAGLGSLVALVVFGGALVLMVLSFLTFLLIAFLAQVVIGLATGRWVLREEAPGWGRGILVLAVGLLPVVILTSLPTLGGWINLVFVVVGLGAILVSTWRGRRVMTR